MSSRDTVRRVIEIATARAVQQDSRPLFVGTIWIVDEIGTSLLDAAHTVDELKDARAARDVADFRIRAALLKRHIGQLHVMANSLDREAAKYGGSNAG